MLRAGTRGCCGYARQLVVQRARWPAQLVVEPEQLVADLVQLVVDPLQLPVGPAQQCWRMGIAGQVERPLGLALEPHGLAAELVRRA